MKKVRVNGVEIAYEVYGSSGSPLVFTNGGVNYPCDDLRPMARALAEKHTVVIHDCRNSGQSGMLLDDYDHEFGIIADDIAALMEYLGLTPCFVGGLSGGFLKTLQVANRHPEILKGLLLVWPMDRKALIHFGEKNYAPLGELALSDGMSAVAEKWERRYVESEKPELAEYLRNMNPEAFSQVMKKWATFDSSGLREFWGLTSEEIIGFQVPVLVVAGDDQWHPKEVGEELHKLATHSTIYRADESILSELQRKLSEGAAQGRNFAAAIAYFSEAIAPVISDFMDQSN